MTDLFTPKAQAEPAHDPRIRICRACRKPGASCGMGDAWWCYRCAPDGWFPGGKRGGRA
jgi:hypothetical protein